MENDKDILDDQLFEPSPRNFTRASKGKRFANYIIDRIVWTFLFLAIAFLLGMSGQDELIDWMANMNKVVDYLVTALFASIYFIAFEYLANGKTVGKLITRTRVVGLFGESPSLGTIVKRSLSRFVPLEPFSFLNDVENGWHDNWSQTMVVEDEKGG